MKRILYVLSLVFILVSCGTAKKVSYSHRPLAAEGCLVSYSAVSNNGQAMVVVTVESDRLVFSNNPTLMLKNFKGEVLTLEGMSLQSRSETAGVLIYSTVIPITELNAMAEFPIQEKDIDFFSSGISKVRLSTVPYVHEKEFARDYIGSYLYSALRKVSMSKDTF